MRNNNEKKTTALPQYHAAADDIEMMRGRASEHAARAGAYDADAMQTVMGAEKQANDLVRNAQEEAAELVRQAQEKAADLVRQTQESAGAHVAQAKDRAAQLHDERDREKAREQYWAGLAAEEAVKAGLPPEPPARPEMTPVEALLGSPLDTRRDPLAPVEQGGGQPS